MIKFFTLLITILIFIPTTALATPTEYLENETVNTNLDAATLAEEINTSDFENQLADLDQLLANQDIDISISQIWKEMLNGEREFTLEEFWNALKSIFFANIKNSSSLLGQLLILAIMAVLLTMLKNNFAGGQIAQISRWVVYLLLIGIGVLAFVPSLQNAAQTIEIIRDLLYTLLLLLIPLLSAIGGLSTAALLNPALLFALTLLMTLMANFVFPMIFFSAILRLCGDLTPRLSLEKMAKLFKDIALGTMSIITTVFIAFLGFTGLTTASWDGLTIKAVKTASGTFIPVVGRSLADAMDSVLATALILKNSLGLVGSISILLICAIPAIHILLQAIIFRIAGALIQPLGEEKLSEAVTGLGNSLIMLFAALAISGLFAYFALALLVGLGNITMMMR